MELLPAKLEIDQRLCLWAAASTVVAYITAHVLYNLYFHPLAGYPGPLLGRSSLLWRLVKTSGGRFHRAIDEQHKRYGPVFRVSPNELSFATVQSWKDIYGPMPSSGRTCIKGELYNMVRSGYRSACIISERDPRRHAAMKKNLAAAFSTRALLQQESVIRQCVDGFVQRVGEHPDAAPGATGLNMTKWYEMVAFDIIGEMAFGRSFGAVESGRPHFWSELIVEHIYFVTLLDTLRRYPLLLSLGKLLLPFATVKVRDKHSGYTRAHVERRLNAESARKDFLTNLVGKVKSGDVDKEEMIAHSSTLVLAGGETTSTFLAATTYYLCKTPHAYQKLRSEIRAAFTSYDAIDAAKAQQLPYLQAVIAEGLRMYSPASQGLPRISPGAFIDGHWVPPTAEIYTSAWTVTHDEQNFHAPTEFKPERWIDPECTDNKEASQPFSLGPRGCIGRNFAYVEMNLILATLFWKYDLELVDNSMDWEGQSRIHIMWWKPELRVRVLPREFE